MEVARSSLASVRALCVIPQSSLGLGQRHLLITCGVVHQMGRRNHHQKCHCYCFKWCLHSIVAQRQSGHAGSAQEWDKSRAHALVSLQSKAPSNTGSPVMVKSKRLSSITAKYSLQERAEEKWWCINSCLINNYAFPCLGVCCDRRESFAWIFSKGMVEPGFGGWSEIEVNLKGQGRDPRLVTEWPTRYLEVKELICVRYSIKKKKKRRQWREWSKWKAKKMLL